MKVDTETLLKKPDRLRGNKLHLDAYRGVLIQGFPADAELAGKHSSSLQRILRSKCAGDCGV